MPIKIEDISGGIEKELRILNDDELYTVMDIGGRENGSYLIVSGTSYGAIVDFKMRAMLGIELADEKKVTSDDKPLELSYVNGKRFRISYIERE
ncbi:MAG: hypothetical protein ABI758_03050 [Candidatus Woesebacteria bacterium]